MSEQFTPEHLELWTMPSNYGGHVWPCYYVFLGKHRDSDALTRSNFECALKAIGGESETVEVVREGHWAVGWVEWIAIHQDDEKALRIADEVMCSIAEYPALNDEHLSDLEFDEACEYWERMSVSERLYYCKRAGVSIFSARREHLPLDNYGEVLELLISN